MEPQKFAAELIHRLEAVQRTREAEEELVAASRAIRTLGGGDVSLETRTLTSPAEPEPLTRTIVSVRKLSPTPAQYPRDYGAMKKKGL